MNTVLIVLGYKLNDDNSAHPLLIKRLNMTLKVIADIHPVRVILSGGIPYPEINNISEAQVMFDYLISHGVSAERNFAAYSRYAIEGKVSTISSKIPLKQSAYSNALQEFSTVSPSV